jgi:hypothetical protein
MLVAKDPDFGQFSSLKSASAAGVSVEFAAPSQGERDVRSGLNLSNGAAGQSSIERIDYALRSLTLVAQYIERDRAYAEHATGEELRGPPHVNKFARDVIAPTARRLVTVHQQRRSRDIWWLADRELISALLQFIESIPDREGEWPAHQRFTVTLEKLWANICDYENRFPADDRCTEAKGPPVAALKALGEQRAPIFEHHSAYGRLMAALLQYLAGEDVAALQLLHSDVTKAAGTANTIAGRVVPVDEAFKLVGTYRAANLYFTFLQLSDAHASDATAAIRKLRVAEINLKIGEAILSLDVWQKELHKMLKAAPGALASIGGSHCPSANPYFKKFLDTHLITQNNYLSEASRAYLYVQRTRRTNATYSIKQELKSFPLECLGNPPVPGQDQGLVILARHIDARNAVRYKSIALFELAIAQDNEVPMHNREKAACLALDAIRKARDFSDRTLTAHRANAAEFTTTLDQEDEHAAAQHEAMQNLEALVNTMATVKKLGVAEKC